MSDIFESIPSAAVERAEKAAPNGQRCLIENCSNDCAVELAHVVDRELSLDEGLLGSLEWHWGLKKGTLNLDTHRNIFFLGASLYKLYRQMKWVLVPEDIDGVLERYFYDEDQAHDRKEFPVFQEKTFKYRFVPLFDMEDIYIARQSSDSPSQVDIHEYPFDTMPLLISHIHPTFVLMHLSSVAYSRPHFPRGTLARFHERFPVVPRLKTIYQSWVAMVPSCAYRDRTYVSHVSLRRNYNSDDGYSDTESNDGPPQHLDYANESGQPQLPNSSSAYPQDGHPDFHANNDSDSIVSAHTPPHRIRLLFPSRKRLMGAYWDSESGACQSAGGGEGSHSIEGHVIPQVPIRYSAGWSPETITQWARNTHIASNPDHAD
ncbi:hypothetical protein CVT24_006635 [Panaeolus cyanescens]|uniref:HNH nuclease domain-containing protein n=1 Tax=Panaeolus cyanescens TaxID=181874 RepID=A0A409X1E1_9AGAR|nr:hypothetical protein CVT24_006635 [Panaeolus cyanescens]